MLIKNIKLINFRNYQNIEVSFEKGINYIEGSNGSGKTSLVEAIGLLSLCKSIRTSDEKEMINLNSSSLIVNALINNQIDREIKIVISEKGKYISIDENEVKRISELMGVVKIISFLPKDVEFFKDSPLKRRKFIDYAFSLLDKSYLKSLSEYNHYLTEIKELIKINDFDETTLDVLLKQISKKGIYIMDKRKEYICLLNKYLANVNKYFSDNEFVVNYQSDIKNENNYYLEVKNKLLNDLKYQNRVSVHGIHLDDIVCYHNNTNLSNYGSQGQNRLGVISIKLALFDLIKDKLNEEPIVILDDVLSELDELHQEKLINVLKNIEQVFITGTKFNLNQKVSLYCVEKNEVRRIY